MAESPEANSSEQKTDNGSKQGKLLKAVGVWFGISAAIGNTIAAGIVRTPGDIAQWLPNEVLFLGVWLVGGLYALFGASSLAELAVAIPKSGGQYNYSRRALGEYAGFIVGWSDWLANCGTLAAVAIVVGEYIEELIPSTMGYMRIIAISTIVSFAVLQSRGVNWGSRIQVVTAVMKTFAFLILVLACFIVGPQAHAVVTSSAPPDLHLSSGWPLIVAMMLALQAVFYSIDGWHGVIYLGEEVKDPVHDVPRSIFISVFSVVAIYMLLSAAVLYVIPINEIAGNKFALGVAAEHVFGQYGGPIIRIIMIVSLLSCINAVQLFASRILYGLSHDGLFFKATSKVNEGGTPVRALALSTLVAILFVFGSFEQVMAILSFFFVANYALSYVSIFVLRKNEPELARPYKAWSYPYTSGAALLTSVAFLVGALITNPENAAIALLILALSFPIYKYFRKISET